MDVPFCLPAFSRSCSVAAGAVVVCSGRAGFRLRFSFCFVLFWPYLPTRPVQMVLLLAHEVGSSWSRGWDDAAATSASFLPCALIRLPTFFRGRRWSWWLPPFLLLLGFLFAPDRGHARLAFFFASSRDSRNNNALGRFVRGWRGRVERFTDEESRGRVCGYRCHRLPATLTPRRCANWPAELRLMKLGPRSFPRTIPTRVHVFFRYWGTRGVGGSIDGADCVSNNVVVYVYGALSFSRGGRGKKDQ